MHYAHSVWPASKEEGQAWTQKALPRTHTRTPTHARTHTSRTHTVTLSFSTTLAEGYERLWPKDFLVAFWSLHLKKKKDNNNNKITTTAAAILKESKLQKVYNYQNHDISVTAWMTQTYKCFNIYLLVEDSTWQSDDFLPEKWHKTPNASGKIDQMTGNVQPLILPVFHMLARTAERTASTKILIGCLEA